MRTGMFANHRWRKMRCSSGHMEVLQNGATCVFEMQQKKIWHQSGCLCLLTGENMCVTRWIQSFDTNEFQRRATEAERRKNKKERQDGMRDTQLQDEKSLKMCFPCKARSFLLPRQRSLLGNSVAMARVSSVMQTWPHPPTPQQLWGASVSDGSTEAARVCSVVAFSVFLHHFFSSTLLIFSYTMQRLALSAPLTHDLSSIQGGGSSRGAGTNTECVATVQRPTSFCHSWSLVSEPFWLAVEPDTLWQCSPWQRTLDTTRHWLHPREVGTFIQSAANGKQWICELTHWFISLLVLFKATCCYFRHLLSRLHVLTRPPELRPQTAGIINTVVESDSGWVMVLMDRGHHFSGQPITLMDMTWDDGFARRCHAYGSRCTCLVCLAEWSGYGSYERWAWLGLQLHLSMSVVLLLRSGVSGGR